MATCVVVLPGCIRQASCSSNQKCGTKSLLSTKAVLRTMAGLAQTRTISWTSTLTLQTIYSADLGDWIRTWLVFRLKFVAVSSCLPSLGLWQPNQIDRLAHKRLKSNHRRLHSHLYPSQHRKLLQKLLPSSCRLSYLLDQLSIPNWHLQNDQLLYRKVLLWVVVKSCQLERVASKSLVSKLSNDNTVCNDG